MIFWCADDYALSEKCSDCVDKCIEDGVLNKVSVLANGDAAEAAMRRLSGKGVHSALHINLVEGKPMTDPKLIPMLVDANGYFKHSFVGLLRLAASKKKCKAFRAQVYREIYAQVSWWQRVTDNAPMYIDSHQHTHMIPLIFTVVLCVLRDLEADVRYLRVPDEPLSPYILKPSLWFTYKPVNLIKQWLLKCFAFVNRKDLKQSGYPTGYFMGVLFSGHMDEKRVRAVLPYYKRLAEKKKADIELAFHPGYIHEGEAPPEGIRSDFEQFYLSPGRKLEYETVMKLRDLKDRKEGF